MEPVFEYKGWEGDGSILSKKHIRKHSTTLYHTQSLLTIAYHHHSTPPLTKTTMSFNAFFHPFFQILDEPYLRRQPSTSSRTPTTTGTITNPNTSSNFLDDPFFFNTTSRRLRTPAVEINEEGDHYVVEAELPGVRKEDVDVRIGDAGRSLTIEGKSVRRFGRGTSGNEGAEGKENTPATPAAPAEATPKDRAQGKLSHHPLPLYRLRASR